MSSELLCVLVSIYGMAVDATEKSPLAEGVDDDNGTDVVVDALVNAIHFFLQSVSEFQLEIEPGFVGFFGCGEKTKVMILSSNGVAAPSTIFSSFTEANTNRKFSA